MKYIVRRVITALLALVILGVGAYGAFNYFGTDKSKETSKNEVAASNKDNEVEPTEKTEVSPMPTESNGNNPQVGDNNASPDQSTDSDDKSKDENQNNNAANNTNIVGTAADLEKIIKSEASVEEKIKKYLGTKSSKVGLAYYDIESGKGFSINGDKYYNAASTVKVQMNMVLFDMVKEGKISIDKSVLYNAKTDYEGGTGILQGKDKSKPIPLQTLSDCSIMYSDNIATRMIIRTINRTEMKKRFSSKVGHTVPTSNTVTPNEELKFLKLLYENKDNNSYYTRLIGIMKQTSFHDRLDKYVSKSIVAHKIGNYGSYVNDVGLIYAPKPYIVAVYTDGLAGANETIANINKILYEAHK